MIRKAVRHWRAASWRGYGSPSVGLFLSALILLHGTAARADRYYDDVLLCGDHGLDLLDTNQAKAGANDKRLAEIDELRKVVFKSGLICQNHDQFPLCTARGKVLAERADLVDQGFVNPSPNRNRVFAAREKIPAVDLELRSLAGRLEAMESCAAAYTQNPRPDAVEFADCRRWIDSERGTATLDAFLKLDSSSSTVDPRAQPEKVLRNAQAVSPLPQQAPVAPAPVLADCSDPPAADDQGTGRLCAERNTIAGWITGCSTAPLYIDPTGQMRDPEVDKQGKAKICVDTGESAAGRAITVTLQSVGKRRVVSLWPGEPSKDEIEVPTQGDVLSLRVDGKPNASTLAQMYTKWASSNDAPPLGFTLSTMLRSLSDDAQKESDDQQLVSDQLSDLENKLRQDPTVRTTRDALGKQFDLLAQAPDPKAPLAGINGAFDKVLDAGTKVAEAWRDAATDASLRQKRARLVTRFINQWSSRTPTPVENETPDARRTRYFNALNFDFVRTLATDPTPANGVVGNSRKVLTETVSRLCFLASQRVLVVSHDALFKPAAPPTLPPDCPQRLDKGTMVDRIAHNKKCRQAERVTKAAYVPPPPVLAFDFNRGIETLLTEEVWSDRPFYIRVSNVPPGGGVTVQIDGQTVAKSRRVEVLGEPNTDEAPPSQRLVTSAPTQGDPTPTKASIIGLSGTLIVPVLNLWRGRIYTFRVCSSASGPPAKCDNTDPPQGTPAPTVQSQAALKVHGLFYLGLRSGPGVALLAANKRTLLKEGGVGAETVWAVGNDPFAARFSLPLLLAWYPWGRDPLSTKTAFSLSAGADLMNIKHRFVVGALGLDWGGFGINAGAVIEVNQRSLAPNGTRIESATKPNLDEWGKKDHVSWGGGAWVTMDFDIFRVLYARVFKSGLPELN
ncbi:MAG: hypothetical protein QM778_17530 [Myxococcales bacterium]